MPRYRIVASGALVAVLLVGCVIQPTGPTVSVMPAPYKPFPVFQDDEVLCRHYAAQQTGGEAETANDQAINTAIIAAILGAGLGAAIGNGQGAAVGAATGAVLGTAAGSGPSSQSQYSLQQRYNVAYLQCMYSRGNQVPGFGYRAVAPPPGYPPP
jgi:hypothetical protein